MTNVGLLTISLNDRKGVKLVLENWWNLQFYLNIYGEACDDYNVTSWNKLKCLHSFLVDEAEIFYCENLSFECKFYKKICRGVLAKNRNFNQQIRVRKYLQRSSIDKIVGNKYCHVSDALKNFPKNIVKFVLQGLSSCRSEEAIAKYWYSFVLSCEWTRFVPKKCYPQNPLWIFHQSFTALNTT